MARRKSRGPKQHLFRNKLLLNQWLVSLFGIDPLAENRWQEHKVLPVALNESEYQFISDLKTWCDDHKSILEADGMELFLLRNQSRGKGVGFFEAGNFHPDFILWLLAGGKQYVSFIEPHGLLHEGPASEKVLFHKRIKDVQQRLNDPAVILNSFILSWTQYAQLQWDNSREALEDMHVLFMTEDRDRYIDKLFDRLRGDVEIRLKDQFETLNKE